MTRQAVRLASAWGTQTRNLGRLGFKRLSRQPIKEKTSPTPPPPPPTPPQKKEEEKKRKKRHLPPPNTHTKQQQQQQQQQQNTNPKCTPPPHTHTQQQQQQIYIYIYVLATALRAHYIHAINHSTKAVNTISIRLAHNTGHNNRDSSTITATRHESKYIQFSSVQFSSRWYLCAKKSP